MAEIFEKVICRTPFIVSALTENDSIASNSTNKARFFGKTEKFVGNFARTYEKILNGKLFNI